jgi:hypothetical protein
VANIFGCRFARESGSQWHTLGHDLDERFSAPIQARAESSAPARSTTAPGRAPAAPLPAAPPSGKLLHPRIDGRNFVFQVKDPDGKPVEFRLTLQAPDAGTLNVTRHAAVYPEFEMKRIQ